jgi:UDP-glucose 4-epimerase
LGDARDAAEGILAVLERPAAVGEVFNIGAQAPFAADEIVHYVAKKTGLPVVSARVPTARGPWYISSAKARAMLGYQPSHSVFDMLDEAFSLR